MTKIIHLNCFHFLFLYTPFAESEDKRTFENVIAPLDKLCSDITFPFLTAKNLSYAKGGDFQKAFQRVSKTFDAVHSLFAGNSMFHIFCYV